MSDTNLDPSISALSTRATEVAASANARELLNLSRIAPSLEQSENAGLEVAINSRAAGLAPSATATELKSIGKAIGNVLEPDTFTAGAFIPAQLDQSGKFLGTSGTSKNWSGVTVSGLSEVNISAIANDETLVYNHVSSQFENSSQVFNIPQYAQTADLPASASSGATAFDASTAELKYWDGSEWKVAAVVAAGGSTSSVDWQSVNTTFVHRIQSLGNDAQWGKSAAISGDYFCVADSENAGSYRGTLYIYDTATGTLQHSVIGTVSNGQQGVDYEGHGPTAMSGDYIAISSGYHMNQDRVRIIQASTGNVVATITRPSELANDCRFGQSVALNEDCSKLVVGAPRNLSNRGRVYVYDISDKNNLPSADDYTLSLQSYTHNPGYKFGESVAISGNILVTASPGMWEGIGAENRGSVFDATTGDVLPSGAGDSKFVQPSGYTAPFGHSVDVFENGGDFIAAFCENEAVVSGEANAGAVHIYNSSGDLIRTIGSPDASQNDRFGTQAKILSSDTIMISAPSKDTGGEFSSFPHRRGRVYFYSITDGSLLATLDNPDDLSSSGNHNHYRWFGRCISADKTTGKILVAQGPGGPSHRAYIFEAPVTQSGGGSGSVVFSPAYQSEDTYSAGTHTFNVSGEYIITPSADVTATVKMWGAGGGGGYRHDGGPMGNEPRYGGPGGYSEMSLTLTSGQEYVIQIGEGGLGFNNTDNADQGATWQAGGGNDVFYTNAGNSEGGGYTGLFLGNGGGDTSVSQGQAILIAGGGGAGGDHRYGDAGGAGGGDVGQDSVTGNFNGAHDAQGATGGDQSSAGASSPYNGNDTGHAGPLQGGLSQSGNVGGSWQGSGLGGGGGGYFGGGGGNVGGGGGGSGYVNDTYGTGLTTSIAAGLGLNHNGLPPYDDDSDYPADAGKGGYGIGTSFRPAVVTQSTGEDGYNGYDGAVVIIIS